MNDLYSWIAHQHHGLHTFKSFQDKLEQFAEDHPAQRGLCRVLSHLVQDYIEAFDEAPLPAKLARDVHHRLMQLLASLELHGDSERKLADINRVAGFALWPIPQSPSGGEHRPHH